MPRFSRDSTERIGTKMRQWSARPVRASNVRLAVCFLVVLALIVASAVQTPDPVRMVRGYAGILVMLHAILHFFSLRGLRRLVAAGVEGAAEALASYRDPRRISNMDLTMAWIAVVMTAPAIGWFTPS